MLFSFHACFFFSSTFPDPCPTHARVLHVYSTSPRILFGHLPFVASRWILGQKSIPDWVWYTGNSVLSSVGRECTWQTTYLVSVALLKLGMVW
ncbi:hypothetical protein F4823DRAFT_595606 [Ustulina deusta]|nr:hypothetical protein F4823DRAFT_595606 [Ustulina deusta]